MAMQMGLSKGEDDGDALRGSFNEALQAMKKDNTLAGHQMNYYVAADVFWFQVRGGEVVQPDVPDGVILSESYYDWTKYLHIRTNLFLQPER